MKKYVWALGLVMGVLAFGILSNVSYAAPANITYPISELGNCQDQQACKTYCDDTTHMDACLTYAQQHNLLSDQEIKDAREYQDVLKGKGPGACTDQKSCRAYCDDINHLQECVAFAKDHNLLSSEELTRAQQVAQALANGAKLPGGCTSAQSCETFCSDPKNVSACFAFAQQAGMMSKEEVDQAKKIIPLMEQGKTPGKCTTKDSCESYCKDADHLQECVAFAQEAGMMSKEEADMALKTGGKGPGECNSKDSCDAYCNNEAHQEECLTFAQAHGLISAEEAKNMKEGMAQLQTNMDQLPPAALACLQEKLGQETLDKIKQGTLTPGKQMGGEIKSCIESSMGDMKEKTKQALEQATPEVIACLKNKLSADDFTNVQNGDLPSPQAGEAMKSCFAKLQEEGAKKMKEGIASLTPEMKTCVQQKVGSAKFQKLEQGELSQEDANLKDVFEQCAQQGMQVIQQQMEAQLQQAPEPVRECIKTKMEQIKEQAKTDPTMRSEKAAQPLIQECMKLLPAIPQRPIPSSPNGEFRIPENIPQDSGPSSGAVPPTGAGPQQPSCDAFKSVPSCSFVPSQFKDLCEQCKGQ